MSKTYGVGLAVGKFAPPHNGHGLVVQRASSVCEQVVIVSYSCPEVPRYDATVVRLGSKPELNFAGPSRVLIRLDFGSAAPTFLRNSISSDV